MDRRDAEETVDAELALPADMRARLTQIAELIEAVGLPSVREPHVRHIRGPIWEIRLKGKAGIARALYIAVKEKRVGSCEFSEEDREDPQVKSSWRFEGKELKR